MSRWKLLKLLQVGKQTMIYGLLFATGDSPVPDLGKSWLGCGGECNMCLHRLAGV